MSYKDDYRVALAQNKAMSQELLRVLAALRVALERKNHGC